MPDETEKNLKNLRQSSKLTQARAAEIAGIPLRTYVRYENDPKLNGSLKYDLILSKLKEIVKVDETHHILNTEDILKICRQVFSNHSVNYCYLFGSYAKGLATETSDVDLLISTPYTGLRYYGLMEELRKKLKKKLDLLNVDQLLDNKELLNEVLKDGIKIYG